MTKLERKWWLSGPAAVLAVAATTYLLIHAGIAQPYNAAQWVLYCICIAGLQRVFVFLGWLAVLCVSPATIKRIEGKQADAAR